MKKYDSGSQFEKDIAYSRAVSHGGLVYVSGTTGFDYSNMEIPESMEEQTRNCFENIARALENLDSSLDLILRVNYILPNGEDFPEAWPIIREFLGQARPAATMIVAGLFDPRMKIEIEVTAAQNSPTKG